MAFPPNALPLPPPAFHFVLGHETRALVRPEGDCTVTLQFGTAAQVAYPAAKLPEISFSTDVQGTSTEATGAEGL